MLITGEGTVTRTPVAGIPFKGRGAGGVILMRLSEDARVHSFSLIESEKDGGESAPLPPLDDADEDEDDLPLDEDEDDLPLDEDEEDDHAGDEEDLADEDGEEK